MVSDDGLSAPGYTLMLHKALMKSFHNWTTLMTWSKFHNNLELADLWYAVDHKCGATQQQCGATCRQTCQKGLEQEHGITWSCKGRS